MKDEYFNNSDGLFYCSVCHMPRQKKLIAMGHTYSVRISCRCEMIRQEQEEDDRQFREFRMQIAQLKSSGLQDKYLHNCTFENDLGYNPEISIARMYVENWKKMKSECRGLLLWGPVGTGKTFIAGCIANALLEQCVPVMMTDMTKILNMLNGMYAKNRNEFIDGLNFYDLLILDDLGKEHRTEFAMEQVFQLIDSRYRCRKPMIVTTNLTMEELKDQSNLAHTRIYSRILELCTPLKINNRDIRQQNAALRISEMKEMVQADAETASV